MSSVWRATSMTELTLLPEEDAVRSHFDHRNCRILFRLLIPLTATALIQTLYLFSELGEEGLSWVVLIPPALSLVLIALLSRARGTEGFGKRFGSLLLLFLLAQAVLLRAPFLTALGELHPIDFLVPIVLLLFRLPRSHVALATGTWWLLSAGRSLIASLLSQTEVSLPAVLGLSFACAIIYGGSNRLYAGRRRQFVGEWRRELSQVRERRRMREELDDARKIQLSMLPTREPDCAWLDIAGISIPASEVGGDYYEYPVGSEARQAVVVADVAGHGAASGLVISGIRSCLYLLHETPLRPLAILESLDRMVKHTSRHRLFVTLIYCLFDLSRRRVVVSAAGHPPLLRYEAASGDVEEIGFYALPLGTRLPRQLGEREVSFAPDDVFLLYTDGIAETVNRKGEVYGSERLRRRLGDLAGDRDARELRDALLGDVWNFKADSEQTDDVTLVVVRVR